MPLYDHIDNCPAKVFFEILNDKDYQKLRPKPKEKNLDSVFLSIYDDYFIKSDNQEAKEYLRLQNVLVVNEYKIEILKQSLAFYFYNKTTKEMRQQFIEALKIGYGIVIDENAEFIDEVGRVLNIELGILRNEVSLAEISLKEIQGSHNTNDFGFYDAMIGLSNVLTGNSLIKDDMTLSTYIALKKSAEKQIESMKKANKK